MQRTLYERLNSALGWVRSTQDFPEYSLLCERMEQICCEFRATCLLLGCTCEKDATVSRSSHWGSVLYMQVSTSELEITYYLPDDDECHEKLAIREEDTTGMIFSFGEGLKEMHLAHRRVHGLANSPEPGVWSWLWDLAVRLGL
jgi:hypothetical protein